MLNLKLKKQIKEYCDSKIPNESCGLLIYKNNDYIFNPCQNISHHPKEHCILSPLDYVNANKLGEIKAHVHSHPNEGTSLVDNYNAFYHNIYSVIYAWKINKFYIVEPKLKSYLNRNFDISKDNCYDLIRDYYKVEKNVLLNVYNINKDWENKTPDIILENFEKEGFYEVKKEEIIKDDILFFKNKNDNITHLGIFLGDNLMLHHPLKHNSYIEYLDARLLNIVKMCVRYKGIENG